MKTRLAAGLLAASAAASCADAPTPTVAGGDAARGAALIAQYGCGSCHRIPGIALARGTVGPPLGNLARRVYLGGVVPNAPEHLILWLMDPQALDPPTAMPNLGLSEAQARDIAAYLYTLED